VSRLRLILATWFGSGLFPFAPGTAGTMATVPLVALLWRAGSTPLHLVMIVLLVVAGLWASGEAETHFGKKDPGPVVIDEAAGFLVATIAVPAGVGTMAASFLLFRVLDIVKPWPANRLERMPGARGIMFDDLVAGLYANLLVQLGLLAVRKLG